MIQIPPCNHKVGAKTLHQKWAKIINCIKQVGKHPRKLSAETVSVILLRAKTVNAKSKTPATSKLNTQLQNHNSLQNLHENKKSIKINKKVKLSQQNQFQLKSNEILA